MRLWLIFAAGCSFQGPPVVGQTISDAQLGIDAQRIVDAPAAVDAAPTWKLRLPLTITNSSTMPMSVGYQVGLAYTIDMSPCFSTGDHRDVRIMHDTLELPRVIEPAFDTTFTWFPLAVTIAPGGVSSGEYWLYCDNQAAPAVPDQGAAVFDFYDPFDTLDLTKWTVNNDVTVAGGQLICNSSSPGDNGVVTTAQVTSLLHAVDFAATLESGTANWWGGYQDNTLDVRPWSLWYQHDSGSVSPSYADSNGLSLVTNGTDLVQDTNEHIYTVEDYGAVAVYRFDDGTYQTLVYAPLAPPAPQFDIRLWNNSFSAGQTVRFDWVRLRQVVTPTPTVAVGPAQML